MLEQQEPKAEQPCRLLTAPLCLLGKQGWGPMVLVLLLVVPGLLLSALVSLLALVLGPP